jgi:hypothetical protein
VFREEGEKTMMGVFKYDNSNEGKMSFVTKLDSVTDRAGENIVPTTTMLHQQDSQLLMLDAKKPDKVFQMDLETGKVVEEWKASESFDISSIAPTQKYSQLEQESTILAANQNMLFRLDPRLSGNKLVESEKLVYKTNPGMTCIATNGAGQIVSGDKRGDLRLYSHANKRAKTRLPSLGNGIIGVDVTEDGKWVLATAKNYLLVIPTEVPNDSKQRTGFQVGMSAAKKPKPIKLTLHPTDLVTYNIKKIDFTPAHFNMSSTGSEKWIVTSTGKYIITFNFSRVVAGKQFAYKIKKCNDKIVSDNFRYGLDNEVVVVEPHNLYVEERRGGR